LILGVPTGQILRFAAIFFALNLAFDAYRAGGLTVAALGSAAFVTILATAIYVVLMRLISRRRKD
jgi:hypothetical protein